jgi:hypothetical protein
MRTLLWTLALVVGLAASGWTAPIIWDTTLFIQEATNPPYTVPAEDYVSHTSGVAAFLSATWYPWGFTEEDAIRWVQHFTPPPSGSITAARLLITLDDDDYTDENPFGGTEPEQGHLSMEGYWIPPSPYQDHYISLIGEAGTFEVDDGTVAFDFTQNMINKWLYNGVLDCVFYAEAGDFYIVRSDLEITLADGQPQPVPEPSTILLLGSGLIGLAGYAKKKFF